MGPSSRRLRPLLLKTPMPRPSSSGASGFSLEVPVGPAPSLWSWPPGSPTAHSSISSSTEHLDRRLPESSLADREASALDGSTRGGRGGHLRPDSPRGPAVSGSVMPRQPPRLELADASKVIRPSRPVRTPSDFRRARATSGCCSRTDRRPPQRDGWRVRPVVRLPVAGSSDEHSRGIPHPPRSSSWVDLHGIVRHSFTSSLARLRRGACCWSGPPTNAR